MKKIKNLSLVDTLKTLVTCTIGFVKNMQKVLILGARNFLPGYLLTPNMNVIQDFWDRVSRCNLILDSSLRKSVS